MVANDREDPRGTLREGAETQMTAAREQIQAPWGESVEFLTKDKECVGILRDAGIQAAPRECGSVGVWLVWRGIRMAVSSINTFNIAGEVYMTLATVHQGAESRGESIDSLSRSIQGFYSGVSTLDARELEIVNRAIGTGTTDPAAERKKKRTKKRRERKQEKVRTVGT